ncbi:hypothetical protein BGZ94_007726 [Podila epigama]|nr:hypothetical protein BGZ94_007726 [Podila epigama]
MNKKLSHQKRDLLGNLIPFGSSVITPAAAVPPPAAQPPAAPTINLNEPVPLPSLINSVLAPLPTVVGGATSTTTVPVLGPGHSASGVARGTTAAGPPPPTDTSLEENSMRPSQNSISPGLIAFIVVVLLSLLIAVMFSCYKIRQARHRRHRNLDEDILKNHAGSVGYSEGSGGYGMYIGKESPDLWRKNLDLFHRG